MASFLDELWQLLQNIHAFLDLKNEYDRNGYPNDRVMENVAQQLYRIKERRHKLTELINSTRIRAKVAYAYGEGDELKNYNDLINLLRPIIIDKLSAHKVEDWDEKSREIHVIFNSVVDPKRANLERTLMEGTRVKTIFIKSPVLRVFMIRAKR